MKKTIVMTLLLTAMAAHGQSIEECQQAAERNYPLIRQYDLISKTTRLTLDNIQKGWLPQVSASAQASYQSDVTSWPEQMQAMYEQMGLNMKGLTKDQYKIGIDVQQTVFDGGAIKSAKDIALEQSRVQKAQTDVTLYQVRRRVNEMYFGLLLLDKHLQLNADLQTLLASNEQKLSAMFRRGTAAESDYLAMKAERLGVVQQATSLQSQRKALAAMLSALCGMEVTTTQKPALPSAEGMASEGDGRPELRLADAQLRLADAQERQIDAALKPRLQVFAQGFYGYPGLNMFEDMMSRRWSLNGMIGARLQWNIGALYTRKNDKAKIQMQRYMAENSREVFLFNNRLEQMEQSENIARYRRLMADDEEIIRLRAAVRKAAESKLAHGIIDVNDLVKEINVENAARLQQATHEIEMLKEIYDLQFTVAAPGEGMAKQTTDEQ
jgi:outer membrane protein TolC